MPLNEEHRHWQQDEFLGSEFITNGEVTRRSWLTPTEGHCDLDDGVWRCEVDFGELECGDRRTGQAQLVSDAEQLRRVTGCSADQLADHGFHLRGIGRAVVIRAQRPRGRRDTYWELSHVNATLNGKHARLTVHLSESCGMSGIGLKKNARSRTIRGVASVPGFVESIDVRVSKSKRFSRLKRCIAR